MRKTIPLLAGILLLSACGNGAPDDALSQNCAVDRLIVGSFSLCLPDGWTAFAADFGDQGNFIMTIHGGEALGNVMQIHVKKDPLEEPVRDSMEFSERAVEITRQTAPSYAPVSTEPVTVNGKRTLLHIFDATPEGEEAPTRYYQYVLAEGGIAYGFTGILFAEGNKDLEETLTDVLTNVQFL